MKFDASDVLGMIAAALVAAGTWSLWGWAWAALALGVPLLALYFWAEIRRMRRPQGGGS